MSEINVASEDAGALRAPPVGQRLDDAGPAPEAAPPGMHTVDTRYGPILVPVGDDVIGRFLQRYGEWGWLEASFAAALLDDQARVLDGGAFVGTFGLGLSLCRPDASVCYVEANPAACDALRRNVGARMAGGSRVVSAMIGAAEEAVRAGHQDPGNLGSTSYQRGSRLAGAAAPAESATTLRALRERHGPFDLMKLDLEGMEADALSGDAAFLSTGQTTLLLECNEDRRALQMARLLLDWGLSLYYFAFPSFNPRNFNGDPAPIYPMAYEAALLAAPRRDPVLSQALQAAHCILTPIRSLHDLKTAMWRTPRWGMAGWDQATRPELAALAGRLLRSETFEGFLTDDGAGADAGPVWGGVSPKVVDELRALLEAERAERAAVDAGLREASALALGRLEELSAERRLRSELEAGLQEASALAVGRLEELSAERRVRSELEAGLQEASALAVGRLEELSAERRVRSELEAGLQEASALAVGRLEELNAERGMRSELEAGLREASALAIGRLTELTEERKRRDAAEAELARTSARGLLHLAAAGAARDRAEALAASLAASERVVERLGAREAGLSNALEAASQTRQWAEDRAALAEQRAAMAEQVTDIVRNSTVWRISAPVRGLVGGLPPLRSAARRARRLLGGLGRSVGR